MKDAKEQVEPWLRGTLHEVPAVLRAVLHALELAREDLRRWCLPLNDEELSTESGDIPSVGFQVRHIARSVDRLLTYAEGRQLTAEQMELLRAERPLRIQREEVFAELESTLTAAEQRVRAFAGKDLEEARGVGRRALPTSVGGLLVHVADHTQRHVGQAITTAKLLRARRGSQ
jgi:uncharacterized damage-inducible protein DinB